MGTQMSAVVDEKKRINAEIPMSLYRDIEASGYKITEAIIKGFEKLLEGTEEIDCEQVKHEMESKVLAAESKLEARDVMIAAYSDSLENKERTIVQLRNGIQKATTPNKNVYLLCAWVLAIGLASGIGLTALFFYMFSIS